MRNGGGAAGRFSVTLSRQADRKLFEEVTRAENESAILKGAIVSGKRSRARAGTIFHRLRMAWGRQMSQKSGVTAA